MNAHPYLRAYMAGIVVPTIVLLLMLTVFIVARFVFHVPFPIERAIIFPMGVVPSLFGVWNMFYLWLRPRPHLPIGLHGAILPFLLVPAGYLVGSAVGIITLTAGGAVYFDTVSVSYGSLALGFACGLIIYYLVWKYLVGFFNQVLGIA
ncbi:MAG TPA: hypothetical protein VEI26_00650 [Terriglobales bacterium]|nr:hypothetical protein [Terriglobales bacterium]